MRLICFRTMKRESSGRLLRRIATAQRHKTCIFILPSCRRPHLMTALERCIPQPSFSHSPTLACFSCAHPSNPCLFFFHPSKSLTPSHLTISPHPPSPRQFHGNPCNPSRNPNILLHTPLGPSPLKASPIADTRSRALSWSSLRSSELTNALPFGPFMHIHAHHGDNRATPLGNDKALAESRLITWEVHGSLLTFKNTTHMLPYVRPNAIFTPPHSHVGL